MSDSIHVMGEWEVQKMPPVGESAAQRSKEHAELETPANEPSSMTAL